MPLPLFGASVLGDGLGALGHGVLGQFPRQQQPHGGLDLPGGDGGALVVVSQARPFAGDALKYVVDKGVHDAHGLGRDASVWVHLLQHLVHVNGVALLPVFTSFLISFLLCFANSLFGALLCRRGGFRWVGHLVFAPQQPGFGEPLCIYNVAVQITVWGYFCTIG